MDTENPNNDETPVETPQTSVESSPLMFEDKGKQYPLYPFDEPQTVVMANGTIHNFRKWDKNVEVQRENRLKTVIISSAAVIHGENPRDIKSDITRSMLYYYGEMIESFSGVKLPNNGGSITPDTVVDAKMDINGRPAIDYLSIILKREAAKRLYTGKITIERPGEEDEPETDPFSFDDDISEAVKEAEKPKTVYSLTLDRQIIMRQEFGVELLSSGQTTPPRNVVKHYLREPDGDEMGKWETKSWQGYAIPRKGGGSRAERFYNLDIVSWFYDTLIDKIEGASIGGKPVDLPRDRNNEHRKILLAQVPILIKKSILMSFVGELETVGNS